MCIVYVWLPTMKNNTYSINKLFEIINVKIPHYVVICIAYPYFMQI